MTAPTISSPAELLTHVNAEEPRAIVARVVGVGTIEEVPFHLHRSFLGSKG